MLTLRASRDGWWKFGDAIRERYSFKTHGALTGQSRWVPGHVHSPCDCAESGHDGRWGRLPEEYWESAGHASYMVWSYGTPIAWLDHYSNEWVRPDVKYSVTTSKHQSKIFTAIQAGVING